MPTVRFTDNIQRHVDCPTKEVEGAHVREVLDAYRHGLDIDDSGDVFAFGSTTGSWWVSENGGNSWQTVSLNLPPIHSVRFERTN